MELMQVPFAVSPSQLLIVYQHDLHGGAGGKPDICGR